MTRTKIICTIGPAVNSLEKILQLIEAGMDVARLNFSHGSHEKHLESIELLKQARIKAKKPLAIMLDTKGPEIRLGKIAKGHFAVTSGQRLKLTMHATEGNSQEVSIIPGHVLQYIPVGTRILIDNGYLSSYVVEKEDSSILIEFENQGVISSSKGVNIPNFSCDLPALTDRDISDIKFGCKHDVDIIAASFVRSADHVISIKKILLEEKKPDIHVVAKIENSEGVHNFDNIVQVADGIMIARGDLGVEVPLSQVPRLQKMMIRKSYLAGKPAVTATQMLESMIHNPRPTRAEASDVANAIYDSTSCVMLSGETAVGKYPIETVQIMRSIIEEAENDFNYRTFFDQHAQLIFHDVPSSVTMATVKTAYSSNARAIFAFTNSGNTARLLSRLRPDMPIIAVTPNEKSYHQLSFSWGVVPVINDECEKVEEAFKKANDYALAHHHVHYGDLIVVTAGSPFGISGTTNMMMVKNIGDVLLRGHGGYGSKIYGSICMVLSPESIQPTTVRGHIIVITQCDDTYLPFIREASGVIVQNHIDDRESEKFVKLVAKMLEKPVLIRADGACRVLKEGQLVTLDPEKGLIYKGAIH